MDFGENMGKSGIKTRKRKILVIESSMEDYAMIRDILGNMYHLKQGNADEAEVFALIKQQKPDLILLDTELPGEACWQIAGALTGNQETAKIPIVFMDADGERAGVQRGFKLGCADYVRKPFEPDIMRSKISTQIELYGYRHKMEEMLLAERRKVIQVTLEAITAIAKTEEAKDSYTNAHSERVADTSVLIAEKLGWSEEKIEKLRYQALLHDIGKIGIPDRILNKHKNLTDEEYEVMKQHVKIGADILKTLSAMEGLEEGALYHHERWDGTGYLSGKKEREIPEAARIIAAADAYDAMSFERIYRGRLDESYVIEELKRGRGTQFDPEVTDALLLILTERSAAEKN